MNYDRCPKCGARCTVTLQGGYVLSDCPQCGHGGRYYDGAGWKSLQADLETKDVKDRMAQLTSLLADSLKVDHFFGLDRLKLTFSAGELAVAEAPPAPPVLPVKRRLLGGFITVTSYPQGASRDLERAEQQHKAALKAHAKREELRQQKLADAQEQHIRQLEEHRKFRREFAAGSSKAMVSYFTVVLEDSSYPEGFPRLAKLAYVPESKQLVVEFDLPPFEVVPSVREYRYISTRDEIKESQRPMTERKTIYTSVVAQMALRTVHEVFEADRLSTLETVVFNGYVDSIDKGTGQPIRPCLVILRTTRSQFEQIELSRVDPIACLRKLNASVSKSPSELVPVRPVLEFNMVDPRFVEEADVLSNLDQRPNLMELTPGEFESLITNLFEKMGLETRLTQPSRDGGVDCVAYDARPILGGKVIIQAKRYKNTVGVSAVRDLFGAVHNEGASKGILVTTSGYGKATFEFAEGKPLELLSGTHLLYLLKEHAGIEAKIEVPEDWKDPEPDSEN